jgi:hypothetical protein
MEKLINVIDKFFNEEIFEKICEIIKDLNWECGCSTRDNQDRYSAYSYWSHCLTNNDFFSITLKNEIEKKFNRMFKVIRINALCQTFGHDATYHTDHSSKNKLLFNDGQDFNSFEVTFCLYLNFFNDENIETTDGNIYFKVPNEKYILCSEPINNRGVLFPAYVIHKPISYNRSNKERRICITWKFIDLEITKDY